MFTSSDGWMGWMDLTVNQLILYVCVCVTVCVMYFPSLTAHTQRLLKLQSMLRRAPSYRTLELQLLEWQERELFEYFVVVSLKKKPTKNSYTPEVTYQFPKVSSAARHHSEGAVDLQRQAKSPDQQALFLWPIVISKTPSIVFVFLARSVSCLGKRSMVCPELLSFLSQVYK